MNPSDGGVFSFLDWWDQASAGQKSGLCRKIVCDSKIAKLIDDEKKRLILQITKALLKSRLSSAQENLLLETLKEVIRRHPEYQWPERKTLSPGNSLARRGDSSGDKKILYDWQQEALKAWLDNGKRGIIKAVTGSGKTRVALQAIRTVLSEGGKTVVIVPTCALLGQWKKELREGLNLPDEQIGCAGGGHRCHPSRQAVTVWIINSARERLTGALAKVPESIPVLLVVDECHRAGSKENARLFEARFDHSMGLSATPERLGDPGYEKILIPHLGDQIYSYNFSRALKENIIPPFDLVNIGVDFSPWEREEYDHQTEEIGKWLKLLLRRNSHLRWPTCGNYHKKGCFRHFSLLKEQCIACSYYEELEYCAENPQFFKFLFFMAEYEEDPLAKRIIFLLFIRKRLVNDARERPEKALALLQCSINGTRTLLFSERISIADEIGKKLRCQKPDLRCGIYHSRIPGDERKRTLDEFRTGNLDVLISCHALDEGLDVPSADTGIIVSGGSSIRQRIQRLGRILRACPGKIRSSVFNFYVKNTSERQLMFRELREDGMDSLGFYDIDANELTSFLEEYYDT